jgi:hypothetical protein
VPKKVDPKNNGNLLAMGSSVVKMECTSLNEAVVPPILAARARDDRNIPIPGVVWVDPRSDISNFVYSHRSYVDYTYLDWDVWSACANQNRCSYCKHPHDYYMYFVGHQSEVQVGVFMNPAMHDACAHYFCQVYPTVAMPRMRDTARSEGGELPSRLGVYKTRDYKIIGPPGHERTTTPNYRLKAGTQIQQTLWVEYDRDKMKYFNDTERAFYEAMVAAL